MGDAEGEEEGEVRVDLGMGEEEHAGAEAEDAMEKYCTGALLELSACW